MEVWDGDTDFQIASEMSHTAPGACANIFHTFYFAIKKKKKSSLMFQCADNEIQRREETGLPQLIFKSAGI